MNTHGDITNDLPALDPGLAAATLAAFAHRHEVVHLMYAAQNEADALHRIAELLHVDESTVSRILDQPLRSMLPEHRAALDLTTTGLHTNRPAGASANQAPASTNTAPATNHPAPTGNAALTENAVPTGNALSTDRAAAQSSVLSSAARTTPATDSAPG